MPIYNCTYTHATAHTHATVFKGDTHLASSHFYKFEKELRMKARMKARMNGDGGSKVCLFVCLFV